MTVENLEKELKLIYANSEFVLKSSRNWALLLLNLARRK